MMVGGSATKHIPNFNTSSTELFRSCPAFVRSTFNLDRIHQLNTEDIITAPQSFKYIRILKMYC